jgi:hypothetical protein
MKTLKQRVTFALTAMALGMFMVGVTPATVSVAQAKTANQVKNENKAKAYKAKQASKKAAKSSKKK